MKDPAPACMWNEAATSFRANRPRGLPPALRFPLNRPPAQSPKLLFTSFLLRDALHFVMSAPTDSPNIGVAWFDERPLEGQIPHKARHLLESYSGIPVDDVVEHIVTLRNEAWKVFPYPCIGQFRFLEAGVDDCDEYPDVIERLRKGQKLLDMACCFGQTIRQLVADGAPSENIYGCDLQSDFIELGYKLFEDRDRLRTKFLVADIFDPASPLRDLQGQVDMIYTGSFFHLWGLQKQKEVSRAVASLLRPEPGSMILGRQMGSVEAFERTSATGTMFRHNVHSFQKLWTEIGDDLGVSFSVEARLVELNEGHFAGDDSRRIYFAVTRA
jgi:SAM-dependent methyltransferase